MRGGRLLVELILSNAPFFAALLIVGAVMGVGFAWYRYKKVSNINNWRRTRGTITHSDMTRFQPRSGDVQFYAHVAYEYTVDGTKYDGKRVGFAQSGAMTSQKAKAILARYPYGQTVEVYYNPQSPRDATLDTSHTGNAWLGYVIMSVAFAIIAVALLAAAQ